MTTSNFSAPIPVELKERIDKLIAEADIPIGKVVRRLAEWCAEMNAEQLRIFVYIHGDLTLNDCIQQQVRAYVRSDEGHAFLEGMISALVSDCVAEQLRSKTKRKQGCPN